MKLFAISCGILFLLSCDNNTAIPGIAVYSISNNPVIASTTADFIEDLTEVGLTVNQELSINHSAFLSTNFIIGEFSEINENMQIPNEIKKVLASYNPSPRATLQIKVEHKNKTFIVLAGGDIQGTQYAVYDYAETQLGIDPLAYWTGKKAPKVSVKKLTEFENLETPAPIIPYLVYFENDVDELANLKEPMLEYDWESFTNLIDSLVRLRYNGIEFFDMLGRVEFYTREEYTNAFPNYRLNVEYLEKMMDYVHEKGMYIQIDMMMGRQLKTLSAEAADCWTKHKEEWVSTWRDYLENTPVKKADIFALRPRHQIWDWEYKSACDEDKAEVFNQVYAELGKLIDEYNPNAVKVCTCYHDGMEIFNENFSPPFDFIIAWSDNGWGAFDYLPKSTKGYQFGTYMHAGFWLNHDVMDPYPELIDETMTMMYKNYNATSYMMVNGQTFRPFMLNLEAFAESARLGLAFDGEQFYLDWVSRYFGEKHAEQIVKILKLLHAAHHSKTGYVEFLWQIKNFEAYLSNSPLKRPRRTDIDVFYDDVTKFFDDTEPRLELLEEAYTRAQAIYLSLNGDVFFHDHVLLPISLYHDLLSYNQFLIELSKLKGQYEKSKNEGELNLAKARLATGKTLLNTIYDRRLDGDKNENWVSWYDPKKRRPNNGFPSKEKLRAIEESILKGWLR